MKIVFYSNFLNDHQLPVCLEFIKQLGEGNFYFVAHQEISQERLSLGFEDMNEIYPFVIKAYKGGQEELLAQNLMIEADVVIVGSHKNMPIEDRMKLNKLTFRYNERILKNGDFRWLDPRVQKFIYNTWTKYRKCNLYTLCASAYTSRDLSLFGYPKSKCFKWGYFPMVKEYDDIDAVFRKKERKKGVSILWVGRLIDLKHPEYPINVAHRLKKDGYEFTMNIIGIGELEPKLKKMVGGLNLQEQVNFLGALPPAKVREYMEDSQVFLFTSNRKEGWGAVLNEAMNSGCAVIANKKIGSVPFLLKDNHNGLIYDNSFSELYCRVKELFDNHELIESLGRNAYKSITYNWNPMSAVLRFIRMCESFGRGGFELQYIDGICSRG